ncbi:MAG: type IX secretion system membrane protein PorP/SprF, partial [bacterium]
MKRTTCHLIFCVAVIFVLLAGLNAANAQNLIVANPADRGDARASLVNPALAVWQDPIFTLGSKVLHLGVSEGGLDLRNSYFSLTTSNRSIGGFEAFGYGLQGQVLQTPLFNAVAMNAIIGKKVHEKIALAVNVGFINRSFDRSQFNVEVEDDPLFNRLSKWVFPDVGLGVTAVPNRYVTLALSVTHLTQPDLSVDYKSARMPLGVNAGAVVGLGHFRALLGVARDENETLPSIAFESFRPELGLLRLGFGREAATFEGLVYVMRGVSLSYRYNYPVNELRLASSGSHELGLVFNFKRNRSLYEAEWLEPALARKPIINPATAFVVESVFDTLYYVDKLIRRTIRSDVDSAALADLPQDLFFSADSLEPELPKIGAKRLLNRIEATESAVKKFEIPTEREALIYAMKKDHTPRYLDFLQKVAAQMHEPDFRTRIVIPADRQRAYLMLKYLSLFGELTDRVEIAVRDSARLAEVGKLGGRKLPPEFFYRNLLTPPDTFKFELNIKEDLPWSPVSWKFIVEDANGKEILTTSGGKQWVRYYVWDWKLPESEQVPLPGTYYYYLRWWSGDGQVYTAPKKPLIVSRDNRRINIEISRVKEFK